MSQHSERVPDPGAAEVAGALRGLLDGGHPSRGLAAIAALAAGAARAEHVVILLRPRMGGEFILAGTHGLEDESRRRRILPVVRELGAWVEQTRRPALLESSDDARFPAVLGVSLGGARAMPLVCGDRVLGALVAIWPRGAPPPVPNIPELHASLAALGLRHWVWEETARRATGERDEAERLRVRVERAAFQFESTAGMVREVQDAARTAARVTERLSAEPDPELRAVRDLLSEQLARIDRVTTHMLQAGEDRTSGLEPADLGDLVEAALDHVGPSLAAKRIRVSRRLGTSIPPLVLDAHLVRRILTNLLIAVAERAPVKGRLKVEVARRGGIAEIWVAADGPREPGAVLDALWAPFLTPDPQPGFSVTSAHDLLAATGARLETRAEHDWAQSYRLFLPIAENRDRRGGETRRRPRERRRA